MGEANHPGPDEDLTQETARGGTPNCAFHFGPDFEFLSQNETLVQVEESIENTLNDLSTKEGVIQTVTMRVLMWR